MTDSHAPTTPSVVGGRSPVQIAPRTRRGFLQSAGLTTAAVASGAWLTRTRGAAAAGASTPQAAPSKDCDVVVVGAGLSGLSAAHEVRAAGASVIVLEARDRVGGRCHNATTSNGTDFDAGAEFVGPTQLAILELGDRYGLERVATYNTGSSVWHLDGHQGHFPASTPIGPIPPDIGVLETFAAQQHLNAIAGFGFPVGEPWKHPLAALLDSMTWRDWIRANSLSRGADVLIGLMATSTLSVRPHEVSALYVANYIASAGSPDQPGTAERLLYVEGGAQEWFYHGGAARIPLAMAEELGGNIVSNAAVTCIDHTSTGVTVTSSAGTFTARKVIVAMSPPMCRSIKFLPSLPADRERIHNEFRMGRIAKFTAFYDSPWWREQGLSGQVLGNGTPIDVTFESSLPDGRAVLMGFISADQARILDSYSNAEVRAECLASLGRYFGPRALNPQETGFFRWDSEQWSGGGPVAVTAPGTLSTVGPALRRPVGNIHWAGTETAHYWTGYMDGAVTAGRRAAKEVVESL